MEDNQFSLNPLNDSEMDIEAIQSKLYDIPRLLKEKTKELEDLGNKVSLAQDSAKKALLDSNDLKGYVEKNFLGIKHSSGDTKVIISETQKLVKDIAFAVNNQADAQRLSFEFHKELAATTEYLFLLSCGNIATNEAMIRSLNEAIKGLGEKQQIRDPYASVFKQKVQEQFRNVVDRLYFQREILVSIEKHNNDIKQLKKDNHELEQKNTSIAKSLAFAQEAINYNERLIETLKKKQFKINCVSVCLIIISFILAIIALFI